MLSFLIATSKDSDMNVCKKLVVTCGAMTLLLFFGGCSTKPSGQSGLAAPKIMATSSRISQEQADEITIYAVGLVGTPYRFGGNTPNTGFDCSGLIGHVYQTRAGVTSPRTVLMLQTWGQTVASENIRSGDLVIFSQSNVATHAGIYVGGSRFVHAPSAGGEVRLDRLNSKYWSSQQVSFRRL